MDDFFFAKQCFDPSCNFVLFGECEGNLVIDYVSTTATRYATVIVIDGYNDDD